MKKLFFILLMITMSAIGSDEINLFFPGKKILKTGKKRFVAVGEHLFEIKKEGKYWYYINTETNSTDFKVTLQKEREFFKKYFPLKDESCKVSYENKEVSVYNDNTLSANIKIDCKNLHFNGLLDMYDEKIKSELLFELYTANNNFQLLVYKKGSIKN